MIRKHEKKRSLISLTLAIFFFIFLLSCSTSSQRPSKMTRLDLREMGPKEIARFLKNVRSPGGNLEAHYLLACYYQERERHREAIEEFKKVLIIDPKCIKAYSSMGVSYHLLKDHPHAVECYQNALELDPHLDYAENNLGYSYLLQGNQEEAISAFQRAIALNAKENRFHNNLGLAYAMNGQLEKSLEEFKLGGDASKAHFNVAQFYYKKGLYPLAQFHYSTALTLDPSFAHARLALKAVNALMRILKPEALTSETKEEHTSEPFAFGQMEPEPPPSFVSFVTSDTPPVSKHLHDTGADLNDQTGSEAIDSQGRMVPTESQIEKPEPQTEISSLHDSHLKGKEAMALKRFGIEVSNGNGTTGMARKMRDYLETRELEVSRLTNANHFNYRVSKIYYQEGYQEAASHLAGQLPALDGMEETKRFDRPNIKIKLLIGKDLVPHQQSLVKE
jgi:tetratricopeptide (TPR) repeat protein